MLTEMRPSELGEYLALAQIDDWTEMRGDLRAGIVASVIAEVNRDRRKKSDAFKASDFMPYLDAQKTPEQKNSELSARIRAALIGGGKRKGKAHGAR